MFGPEEDVGASFDGNEETATTERTSEESQAHSSSQETDSSRSKSASNRSCCAVALLVALGVTGGVAIAMVVAVENSSYSAQLSANRWVVELLVGSAVLLDSSSPYYKALEWITFHDTKQLETDHAQFGQRYIAAYIYFATSTTKPWSYCNPDASTSSCSYQGQLHGRPVERHAHRWLSDQTECVWAGIHCNEHGEISQLELSTCVDTSHSDSFFVLRCLCSYMFVSSRSSL